ncbi:MAG TPA: SMI1/KNR4 family protein [Ktedonobacteraceae bacterium]|nr:SMI1/KNR4 family protein [Ktedonobacteraceae bacterium]
MDQEQYKDLLERIRDHCHHTAWDALHLGPKECWPIKATAEYDGWYIPSRETFVALKKECNEQEPHLAFPPATERQIKETERQLGFPLPLLLRLLYTQVANGGFGPGYGIIGVLDGFSLLDGFGDTIVVGYQKAIAHATQLVRLEAYEMAARGSLSQEQIALEGERIYLRDFPERAWAEYLVPLCYWGCGICTYLDASTEHIFQGMGRPHLFVAASLEAWLERWLASESLQFL